MLIQDVWLKEPLLRINKKGNSRGVSKTNLSAGDSLPKVLENNT
jgi:hypothetical protein